MKAELMNYQIKVNDNAHAGLKRMLFNIFQPPVSLPISVP
jgi:hypothetical protein